MITMTSPRGHAFLLGFALFLAAMTASPQVANGLVSVSVGVDGNGINIFGNLYCTRVPNSLPIGFQPLPLIGASVSLLFNVGTPNVVITRQTTTNLNGFFLVTLNPPFIVNFNITQNSVLQNTIITVALPVRGCIFLRTSTGTLTGSLTPLNVFIDPALVANALFRGLGVSGGAFGNNISGLVSMNVGVSGLTLTT